MKAWKIVLWFMAAGMAGIGLFYVYQKKPVFSTDIAPLIHRNCTECHRPDGPGPFSLITYEDVLAKAKTIRHVVSNHIMPPWPADTAYSRFKGERYLTPEEIDLISEWVDGGCEQGDPALTPSPPAFPSGSLIGKPDLVVRMQKPFFVKGNNKDHFAVMKLPFELPADTFVRAMEFVPHARKLVHHVNGFMVQYNEGKKSDLRQGEFYVNTEEHDLPDAYRMMDLQNDDGTTYPVLTASVVNYLPGVWPTVYPEGIGGFRMKRKGHILFKDIHYGPSPVETADESYVNVYFSPLPTERPVLEVQMGTLGVSPVEPPLMVPPNEIKTFTTRLKVPFDISILTVNPHMHLLGKSFLAFAVSPGGDTIPLIRIRKWDFRWQYFYTFKKMVRVPAGSVIVAEGVFDNTANNPLNPNVPPKPVGERKGSMRTSDEMFQFIISYLLYKSGDEHISLETKPLNGK